MFNNTNIQNQKEENFTRFGDFSGYQGTSRDVKYDVAKGGYYTDAKPYRTQVGALIRPSFPPRQDRVYPDYKDSEGRNKCKKLSIVMYEGKTEKNA